MGKRRHRRKTRRRRMFRRRKTRVRKSLFGNSQLVKMKYVDAGQISPDPNLGIAPVHTYRLNSVFDPNVVPALPGVQTSVLGHAQMSALFNTSQVVGAKARVTFLPGLNQHNIIMYCEKSLINKLGQPALNLGTILAERNVKSKYSAQARSGGERTVVTTFYSPKRFHAVRDLRDNEDLKSLNGAVPAVQAYINLSMSKTHLGGGALQTLDFCIEIEYLTLWTGPVNPAPSL